MNTPKFLLCENPIADAAQRRQWIVHTHDPVIIAEAFHCGEDGDYPMGAAQQFKRQFEIGGVLDYSPREYIVLGAVWIAPMKLSDNPQRRADNLSGIMRRMADWYEAYLKWEDEQSDEEDDE